MITAGNQCVSKETRVWQVGKFARWESIGEGHVQAKDEKKTYVRKGDDVLPAIDRWEERCGRLASEARDSSAAGRATRSQAEREVRMDGVRVGAAR